MSWAVSAWVKKSKLGSGTRKCVMLVVADYCTGDAKNIGVEIPDGWAVCWAGVDTIAVEAEVSERTVRRVLDDMEALGVIRRERRNDPRGYRTFDFIWVEYARRFADLTESDESNRTESPVGRAPADSGPVDNAEESPVSPDSEASLPDSLTGLPDSLSAPIRNNHQLEPPTNRQDHLGDVTTDRATRAGGTPGSLSIVDAAPSATARPPPGRPVDHRPEPDRR